MNYRTERDPLGEQQVPADAVTTALSPYIGYAATAEIAKESVRTGRPVRDLVLERGLVDRERLERVLSPDAMTKPGLAGQ